MAMAWATSATTVTNPCPAGTRKPSRFGDWLAMSNVPIAVVYPMTTEPEMNFVTSPKLSRPARNWTAPIRNAR